MATIVCQGLQSCLESQVVESSTRTTLRLKLSSPKPPISHPQSLELALKPCDQSESNNNIVNERINRNHPDNGGGGWSFLQDLSKNSSSNKDNVYIHPLMKRYSSKLSEKSLELCTESLGCETGSDISSENSLIFESSSSSSSDSEESEEEVRNFEQQQQQQQQQKPRQYLETKKANCRSFPPPLTTMSGAESLQFRPHREDGRLILTAVQAPMVRSCFQAERSDGRLRLTFVNESASNFDLDVENEDDVEADVDEEDGEVAAIEEEEEIEMEKRNSNCLRKEDSEETGERDTEGNNLNVGGEIVKERDIEGNNLKVGGEIGKKINQRQQQRRSRRCKEENKGLLNWEAFWVATS